MPGKITYNGIDPFGIFVPLVERAESIVDNNGYISHVDKFTLSGFLSRSICSTTWAQYHAAAQTFLDIFSQNFGVFRVFDTNGSLIFESSNAIIRNMAFDDNPFYNLVPYTIEIDCVRSYKNLGIVEPVDVWTTDQGEDALITITHRMSCRGVGDNAFNNAKTFIENLRIGPIMSPVGSPILDIPYISKRETKNRLTGEYSLTETFLYNEDDPTQPTPGIITYTSDISESQGETTVTIEGQIQQNAIDQYGDALDLSKSKFNAIDWDAVAATVYGSSIDKTSVSVQENKQTGVVNFTLVYSSLADNSPYLIDETTISRDLVSGQDCMSLTLTVRVDYGCGGQRFEAVKTYARALNFNSILTQKWAKFGTGRTLSTSPQSKGWSENPIDGSVTISMQYCTKTSKECQCLQNFDFTLQFDPSANQFVAQPIYRSLGLYDVQNLNSFTRNRYGLEGSATISRCCSKEDALLELQGRVNTLSNFYFGGNDKILEESSITTTSNGESLNFSFRWSTAP